MILLWMKRYEWSCRRKGRLNRNNTLKNETKNNSPIPFSLLSLALLNTSPTPPPNILSISLLSSSLSSSLIPATRRSFSSAIIRLHSSSPDTSPGIVGAGVRVVEDVEVEGVCQSSIRDPSGAADLEFEFDFSGSCEDDEGITTGGSDSLSFLISPSPTIPAAASLLLANALFPFAPPALEPALVPIPVPFIPPNPVPALPPIERC